jgi:autotransporter family porin
VLILAGGLAVMGCGGGSDEGGPAAPASQEERQAETEGRDGQDGESVRAEGVEVRGGDAGDGRGEDGESVESGSSIVQSSGGGSVSSSNTNGSGIKTFSGTGSTKLSFNVEQRSRLVWTNTEGRRFSASGAGISIDSRAGRGEVALDAGDYDDVRVSGASWTIVVRSR